MQWNPTWLTIEEFAKVRPVSLYHKEQEAGTPSPNVPENLHVLARSRIGNKKEGRWVLRMTADDSYKLYVNGVYVVQGPAPAYPEHYYYQEVDLTPLLQEEENTLALHLYYQGLVNRVWNSGDGRFGMAAELFLDGETQPLQWRYQISEAFSGEKIGYDTQFTEDFDSRKWEEDWNRPKYSDQAWKPMVPAVWADYRLSPQPTRNLEVTERTPRYQTAFDERNLLFDMGEEITGAMRLTAKGRAGSRILILCGEELNQDGHVRFEMRCNCNYRETWILAEGVCRLEPYDYKGFRYCELIMEEGVKLLEAKALVRHYPMDEAACTLQASEPSLHAIFELCRNGVKYGTQEGYLDCPTREKGQYLGDAVVTARAQVWLTGETRMLEKCISQFGESCRICPGMMAVAPGGMMQEIADFSLLWFQLLWFHYQYTKDREFLGSWYPTARGILTYFRRYERPDGLLEQVGEKWNLVDWPQEARDGYDFPLTRPVVAKGCHNVINALYIGAVKTLGQMEEILGQKPSGNWKALCKSYWKAFYRPKEGLLADSEESSHCALHSNVYALYYGLVPLEHRETMSSWIVKKGFSCGVMHSYFVLKALAGAGRYEDVYRLICNEGPHGWKNMLREGATACFEAWGKDQKWNTSLCHPWASAPIPVLIEEIAGVHLSPDRREGFFWKPRIPKELAWFELCVPWRGRMLRIKKEDGKKEPVLDVIDQATSQISRFR